MQSQAGYCGNQSFFNQPVAVVPVTAVTSSARAQRFFFEKTFKTPLRIGNNHTTGAACNCRGVWQSWQNRGTEIHTLATAVLLQVLNHADLIRRECKAHCLKHSVSSIAQSWCTWQEMGTRKSLMTVSYKAEPHLHIHVTHRQRNTNTTPKWAYRTRVKEHRLYHGQLPLRRGPTIAGHCF